MNATQHDYSRVRNALSRCVEVIGHNDCTDGKQPNGFVTALEHGRTVLKETPAASEPEARSPKLTDQQIGILLISLRRLQDDMRSHRTEHIVGQCEDYDILPPPLEAIDDLCELIKDCD